MRSVCALSTQNSNSIFGERDWTHVQKAVRKNIYARWWWRRVSRDDLDDAIQASMVDLIDYWLSLESSVNGGPDRNFKYAVWRATKEASKFLVGIFQDRSHELSVDAAGEDDDEYGTTLWDCIADPRPGPEDVACDTDELSRARRLIEDADSREGDGWLDSFLEGISGAQAARKAGINPRSMTERRTRGLRRLSTRACQYGL